MSMMNELPNILRFITSHPLTRKRPLEAIWRFIRWQIESRLSDEIIFNWIDDAMLVVKKGMQGATGNIYCGLHEFTDMAFVIHLLRPEDLFIDVGANIGSYTILASKVCGARSISVEPDPGTMLSLQRNILANSIQERVTVVEAALGENRGLARFTVGRGTTNKMALDDDPLSREVRVKCLDDILYNLDPTFIKLDVEGFETQVLKGGRVTLGKESLLGIQTECQTSKTVDMIVSAGFERFFYDPLQRRLGKIPIFKSANALFIRDSQAVQDRLRLAPRRKVLNQTI